MHSGKLVFAQVMEAAPWHTFRRLVVKYQGDFNVRSFTCMDQFLCMAFAQITYRESLRDIEACRRAQSGKLYHLGIRGNMTRSVLADANESRDWHLYCEFAHALIRIARGLYAHDPIAVNLSATIYALDSTTIDLCLSLFPWALFRNTKAAVKLHTLLDLHGSIPTFIHISDGKLHDVKVLDVLVPEPGAFYVMDRGYLDFKRLYTLRQAGSFFVTRAKSNFKFRRVLSRPVGRVTGLICDQVIELSTFYSQQRYPERLRRIRFRDSEGHQLVFLTNHMSFACNDDLPTLQEPLASRAVLQVDQAASSYQAFLWHVRECGEDASVDCGSDLRTGGHREKTTSNQALHALASTNLERHSVRENSAHSACNRVSPHRTNDGRLQATDFVLKRVGQ